MNTENWTGAYPLEWPDGWPRTPTWEQRNPYAKFGHGLTIEKARRRLFDELRRLGATDLILSSNLRLRNDGMPYSSQRQPEDNGVAIYFTRNGQQMVMAHDTWAKVEANINALALAIEGPFQHHRAAVAMLERALAGFAALPDPESAGGVSWRQVLGMGNRRPGETNDQVLAEAERNYRLLRSEAHTDRNGGDPAKFHRVQGAIEQARRELGA